MYTSLRKYFTEILPIESQFQKFFDRFEYLFALVEADLSLKDGKEAWGIQGSFSWRSYDGKNGIDTVINHEIADEGQSWPPLKAGLFNGSVERVKEVLTKMKWY